MNLEVLFCQSRIERLDYFPIHLYDTWHYQVVSDYWDGYLTKTTNIVSVTGDTIINCKQYFIIKNYTKEYNSSYNDLIRIDSVGLRVMQYGGCADTEKVVYNLSSNACGWKNCGDLHTVQSIVETTIEGKVGDLDNYATQLAFIGNYWIQRRTLAKGYGLCHSTGGELMGWVKKLYYAKINGHEYGNPTQIGGGQIIPIKYSLSQNYPNPFNPETTISYSIPKSEHVTLKVFDVLGREVATLADEYKQAGSYIVTLNVSHLERRREMTSGIYFYRLQSGSYSQAKKLILMK